MQELKLIIHPSETTTRIWGRGSDATTRLTATLPSEPVNPDALPRLLEALAGFVTVRAALVVSARARTCAMKLYPGWWLDLGGAGYDLEVIEGRRRDLREWSKR